LLLVIFVRAVHLSHLSPPVVGIYRSVAHTPLQHARVPACSSDFLVRTTCAYLSIYSRIGPANDTVAALRWFGRPCHATVPLLYFR